MAISVAERMNHIGQETAFEVLVRARALEARGRSVIHLEIGEPDFDTPSHIISRAQQALEQGATHYGPGAGLPDNYGEGWETFTATMYLMWDPALPSGCTPAKTVQNSDGTFMSTASTCTSIPIPLSVVT